MYPPYLNIKNKIKQIIQPMIRQSINNWFKIRWVRNLASEHLIHNSLFRKWNAQTIKCELTLCYTSLIFTSLLIATPNEQESFGFDKIFKYWGFVRVLIKVFVFSLYRKVILFLGSEWIKGLFASWKANVSFSKFSLGVAAYLGWPNDHLFVTLAF
jgi:hypothetical protein